MILCRNALNRTFGFAETDDIVSQVIRTDEAWMIEAMGYFVRVVDAGSFSRAASQIGVSPSSVTRKIDQLEADLKTRLLARSTRRLVLTPHGEQFYAQAQSILASVASLRDGFMTQAEEIGGTVSITAFDSFGLNMLTPLIPEFKKRFPGACVALSLDNNMVDLYQSPFDIGIRFGQPDDSTLIYRTLLDAPGVLVASPSYLSRRALITEPEQLHQHECLTFFRPRKYTYWYFQKGGQVRKIRIDASLSSQGGGPMLNWCRQDMGLALVSRNFVEQDLANGALVQVLPEWQASLTELPNDRIYLVWTQAQALRPEVRAMIDFIIEKLAKT